MGQKPDDWRTVSLCHDCHAEQHSVGEDTFWTRAEEARFGKGVCGEKSLVWMLIDAFCKASPKAAEIRQVRNG